MQIRRRRSESWKNGDFFFLFRDEKKSLFNCLVTWVILRLILLLGNNEVLVDKQGLFELLGDSYVFNLVFFD